MSLSRTYRPRTFGDMTGQDAIKETLRKEVETGNIGHAYLFSGPRGVGKTTSARILAKALNCTDKKNGEPCNNCPSCVNAEEGRAVDVIEMDAASHSGVDNVREAIIEHVRFSPVSGAHKVYIIDEAHMLSTASWNALLKTLEEPPAYAVFVLATTELHKVPATIISRCQRFDFTRVSEEQLGQRVEFLADKEGVKIDPEVVASIARHADGCVRDAETMLDQLLSLGEKKITTDIAELVIPASRLPIAADLLSVAGARALGPSLARVRDLDEQGIPLLSVFDDAIQAIRFLLLAADDMKQKEKLQKGDAGEKKLAELVGTFAPDELSEMALLFMERRRDAKQGVDARFALELAMTAIATGVLPHSPRSSMESVQPETKRNDPPPPSTPTPTAKATVAPEPKSATPSKPSAPSASSFTLDDVRRKWAVFVNRVGEQNRSLSFMLTTSRPEEVNGDTVLIRFQYAFHRDKIVGDVKTARNVEVALQTVLGVEKARIEGIVGEDTERKEVRSKDIVSNVLRAFGGEVVDTGAA